MRGEPTGVIVFLELGTGGYTNAEAAFRRYFGEERVGWLGKELDARHLSGDLSDQFDLIGGPLTLSRIGDLRGVRLVTGVLCDPVRRAAGQWVLARDRPDHPHHAAPHTFTLREVMEEGHPFRAALANVATRALVAPGGRIVAREAVAHIASRAALLGDADRRAPYLWGLARFLGEARNPFDADDFRAVLPGVPQGEVMELLRSANRQDLRLMREIQRMSDAHKLWKTPQTHPGA